LLKLGYISTLVPWIRRESVRCVRFAHRSFGSKGVDRSHDGAL